MRFTPSKRFQRHIPLSIPHMSGRELDYVQQAFASNWVSTDGGNLDALESRFSQYIGLPSCALSSGTAAIHLGLRLLEVGVGDEVICPTSTFVATINPVLYLGATPVLVDSCRESWNIDPELLKGLLKRRAEEGRIPKALIVVHLFGQSADMDAIMPMCREYGVKVLEDAAESLGALWQGKQSGSFGDVSAFSFNGNKIITGSSGGMLAAKDEEAVLRARYLSRQARMPGLNYLHDEVGYNYRLSNVLAGVVMGQMDVLKDRVARRREIAFRYRDAFAGVSGLAFMPQDPRGFHTNWLSCFLVDEVQFGMSQAELIHFLAQADISSRPVWKPMHTQGLCAGYECIGGEVAEDLNRRGLCLPSSSCLTHDEQEFVIERVIEAHHLSKGGNL